MPLLFISVTSCKLEPKVGKACEDGDVLCVQRSQLARAVASGDWNRCTDFFVFLLQLAQNKWLTKKKRQHDF